MIIDAKDLIVGRLATFVAKQALLGNQIDILNCDKAVISGEKHIILANYKEKMVVGQPKTGPFFHRKENMFVKRRIRGMLPHKQPKGREAFKRIKCYIGIPEEFQGKKFETVENADVKKLQSLKYMTVENLCKLLR